MAPPRTADPPGGQQMDSPPARMPGPPARLPPSAGLPTPRDRRGWWRRLPPHVSPGRQWLGQKSIALTLLFSKRKNSLIVYILNIDVLIVRLGVELEC